MKPLNIVLVEPQIPQNTGNVARTCACIGARLHLVRPMGFAVSDAKLKRAGLDYWDKLDITYHDSLADFAAQADGPLFLFTTKATVPHTDVAYPQGCYLVFGREDAGLPREFLHGGHQTVHDNRQAWAEHSDVERLAATAGVTGETRCRASRAQLLDVRVAIEDAGYTWRSLIDLDDLGLAPQ